MKLPDLFVNAVTTFDGKALAKGQKQIGGFEKSVKNLGRAFGVTFGAAAIAQFGKASVKAFAEDEAATVRLTQAVNNLGLGFEDTRIKRFISDLESSAHVADDILRPAFQGLLTTTGSVTRSQELLTLALDVSAGSGVDAAEVAKDLGLAYLGQTKGLSKYNTGLSKAELTAASFTEIQTKLLAQYSGQNAARLDTYAGRVAAVGIAYGNLQETVGGALIEAFMKLAGDTTVDDLTDSVDNLADSMADVIELGAAFASPFVKVGKLLTDASDAYVKFLYKVTGSAYFGKKNDRQYGGIYADQYKATEDKANAKARAKAEAEAARREKERLALIKKGQLAEKNKLALSKAAAVFDTNRISIAAALQATYDKETRLRLETLMAIEDENGDLALKKIGELAAFQKNADLQKLAGIKEISDLTLAALNTQLLAELKVINDSKMAEGDKELAREEAFKKYNAAIVAAGQLAAKEQYSERTQIQLTEIARLASLSNTTSALKTATLLRESAELSMIDRVAKAQKAADDARMAALTAYIALLNKVGAGGNSAGLGGTSGGVGVLTPVNKQVEDLLALNKISTPGSQADVRIAESLATLTMFDTPNIPSQYGPGAFDKDTNVTITVNTGVGDPEAIARAVEDIFNQSSYRGTTTNRDTGIYIQ